MKPILYAVKLITVGFLLNKYCKYRDFVPLLTDGCYHVRDAGACFLAAGC